MPVCLFSRRTRGFLPAGPERERALVREEQRQGLHHVQRLRVLLPDLRGESADRYCGASLTLRRGSVFRLLLQLLSITGGPIGWKKSRRRVAALWL